MGAHETTSVMHGHQNISWAPQNLAVAHAMVQSGNLSWHPMAAMESTHPGLAGVLTPQGAKDAVHPLGALTREQLSHHGYVMASHTVDSMVGHKRKEPDELRMIEPTANGLRPPQQLLMVSANGMASPAPAMLLATATATSAAVQPAQMMHDQGTDDDGRDDDMKQADKKTRRDHCQHGKTKRECKQCGGSRFCEHGKRKRECKECGGK